MNLLTKEEYSNYCNRFKLAWHYILDSSYEHSSVIEKICEIRNYSLDGNMPSMLKKVGFAYIDSDMFDKDILAKLDIDGDLGLFTKDGNFLLMDRFIFPVKDMLGNVIALIGWFPDEKKYITTPSKLFKRQCLLFGLEQLSETGIGQNYFLVEGIFDSISVRAAGFNCVALMGISASNYTRVLYSLFKQLVGMPDNDSEGRKVIKQDKWKLPSNSKYLHWGGKIKDIDDLLKLYDMSGVFSEVWNEPDRVVKIDF